MTRSLSMKTVEISVDSFSLLNKSLPFLDDLLLSFSSFSINVSFEHKLVVGNFVVVFLSFIESLNPFSVNDENEEDEDEDNDDRGSEYACNFCR